MYDARGPVNRHHMPLTCSFMCDFLVLLLPVLVVAAFEPHDDLSIWPPPRIYAKERKQKWAGKKAHMRRQSLLSEDILTYGDIFSSFLVACL